MPFKDISYLELWPPFCSVEWNHLCNLGRGYPKGAFCNTFDHDINLPFVIKIFILSNFEWPFTVYYYSV